MSQRDPARESLEAQDTLLFPEIVKPAPEVVRAEVRIAKRKIEKRIHRESRVFAQRLVRDWEYRQRLRRQLREGTLDPSIERMLWAYAYGQPRRHETIDVNAPGGAVVNVIKNIVVRPGGDRP